MIVVGYALSGGGGEGKRADLYWHGGVSRAFPTAMPFEGVVVGLASIGIGVLVAYL